MVKKVLAGMFILAAGFVLGGAFLLLVERGAPGPGGIAPKASQRIVQSGSAFSSIAEAVSPAVVNISAVKVSQPDSSYSDDPFFDFFKDFFTPGNDFGPQKKWREQSYGSGVIVSPEGYIITNNHVVSGADTIRVKLYDRRVMAGKVVGADPKTDIAVVRISSTDDLPTIPWGDSDTLQVGEFVLAVGDPFGLSHTVTMGIISAVGRANVGIADYEDFIQTDAAINPGNSGGPLVDAEGSLIGINTAIFSRSGGYQGIGFAVPSNMVRLVMEQLVKEGRVIRGWLGVTVQELTPELALKFGRDSAKGALIGEALGGSPAEQAGIRSGDIILEYGGREVDSASALKNMVARSIPGTRLPLKVYRDGEVMRVLVTVDELPREREQPAHEQTSREQDALYGLSVISLTEDIARQLNLGSGVSGVVVVGVQEGSPADSAGLKRGDVIQEIERMRLTSLDDYRKVSARVRHKDSVLMFINRGGTKFYVSVAVS